MIRWLKAIKEYPVLTKQFAELQGKYAMANHTILAQEGMIGDLHKEILFHEGVQEQIKKSKELETYWNNKYPMARITYKCRPLPSGKTKIDVPVNAFLTPYDPFIIADLKNWGLYQTNEESETLLPKIYKKIFQTYYKYASDEAQFGIDEVWLFPFEVRASKGSDCEDFGNFQMSYYLAAGTPDWKIRGVAGLCSLGGHATVYVFSEKKGKFVHLNSTYSGIVFDRLEQYPTHDDAEAGMDKFGIKTVWFSYSLKSGFYRFDSTETEKQVQGFLIKKN